MKLIPESNTTDFKAQFKASCFQFASEFLGLIVCIIVAASVQNMIAWADAINGLSASLHVLIVVIVAYRLCQKNVADRFNFGTGRLEAFTSFICDLFVGFGGILILLASAYQLKYPEPPTDNLIYFIGLKGINILADSAVCYSQWKAWKKTESKISKTEFAAAKNELIFDFAVGLLGILSYCFRRFNFACYFSPIGGIVLAAQFILKAIRRMRSAYAELIDLSIPVESQHQIFDYLLANREEIKRIKAVNCRVLKNVLHVDAVLVFQEQTPFSAQCELRNRMEEALRETYPNAKVQLVIEGTE